LSGGQWREIAANFARSIDARPHDPDEALQGVEETMPSRERKRLQAGGEAH
jgi:hypothetical protein